MNWVLARTLAILVSLLSPIRDSCLEGRPARDLARGPGGASIAIDRAWRSAAVTLDGEARGLHSRIERLLVDEIARTPGLPEAPRSDEGESSTAGLYGRMPEVLVDIEREATLPRQIAPITRVSWFETLALLDDHLETLETLEGAAGSWISMPPKGRVAGFEILETLWREANDQREKISIQIRHLEAWLSPMEKAWEGRAEHSSPLHTTYLALKAISMDPSEGTDAWTSLRPELRPRRVLKRDFLPDRIEELRGRRIEIPVFTDIADRRFLSEVEDALDIHWNQSPWALANGVRFEIRWRRVPVNDRFRLGKEGLSEHLARFPREGTALTTGGLATAVRGNVMVLGPGSITRRTLAHELGHLLGFSDCYFRSLAGEGIFGVELLEWNNPLYPDDLMCDSNSGVARALRW